MKYDIKEMIQKSTVANYLSYLVLFGIFGVVLFISFIILLYENYNLFAIICLLISILFIILFIFTKIKCNSTDLEDLTFDIEKNLSLKLVYGDRYVIFSTDYILFLSNKKIFKISDILFMFNKGFTITLYVKDKNDKVYSYILRYKDSNLYGTVNQLLHKYAITSTILYRDNNFMFTTNALYDFNRVSGRYVVVLNSVIEISKTNNNIITVKYNADDKTVTGIYKYNDCNLCVQSFNYLVSNCHNARTNIF